MKKNLAEREIEAVHGIRHRHLRLMRARNLGPRYIKIGELGRKGGRIIYPVDDLERWLQSCPSGGAQLEASA